MKERIDTYLRDILQENTQINVETLNNDTSLSEIGVNSIIFIKLIVLVENEFNFEFEDEFLDFRKLNTFGELIDLIANKIGS